MLLHKIKWDMGIYPLAILPHDHRTDEICNTIQTLTGVHETETLLQKSIGLQAPDRITDGPWRQPGFLNNILLGERITRFEHFEHQLCGWRQVFDCRLI